MNITTKFMLALAISISSHASRSSEGGNVLEVEQGVLEVVEVSTSMLNEFVTPFNDPTVITPEEDQKYITKNGSLLYVRMPTDKEFLQILLRDKGAVGASISLMLLPKEDIPGQHYILKSKNNRPLGMSYGADESKYSELPYQAMIKELLRDAVKDVLQDGYQKNEEWFEHDFELGNFYAKSEVLWEGGALLIERYSVINLGKYESVLNEADFYVDGIKAVAFYPLAKLKPSQSTHLYVVRARKGDSE